MNSNYFHSGTTISTLGLSSTLNCRMNDINDTTDGARLEFIRLILSSKLDVVRCILEAGATVNWVRHDGFLHGSPLHSAARRGNLPAVRLLLEYGADVSLKASNRQWTALHYAADGAKAEHYEICQLLLERGANCDERDSEGRTVFMHAVMRDNSRVAKLLLDHGANCTEVDHKGWTVLHHAVRSGDSTFIQSLLDHGDFTEPQGVMDVVQTLHVLIDNGAHDKFHDSSFLRMVAAGNVNEEVKNVLIQHVAKMPYLNLKVSEYALQTILNSECYGKHYQRCVEEIDSMRGTRFYNDLPLSALLRSNRVISGYARNEDLVKALEGNDYCSKFPIYFSSLKRRFYVEVERQRLRAPAIKILSCIFNFSDPFHPVNQKVFSFLRDEDLQFLHM